MTGIFDFYYYRKLIYCFFFRPHKYGSVVIINYKDSILLVRQSYNPKVWNLPGGGIEPKESPVDAAIRETKEEVDLSILSPKYIGIFHRDYEFKHDHVSVFTCEITNDFFKIDNKEIIEAQWFGLNSLPPNISQNIKESLKLYYLSKNS